MDLIADLEAKRDALTEAIRLLRFASASPPARSSGTALPAKVLRCLDETDPQTGPQIAERLGIPKASMPTLATALHRLKKRGQATRLPTGWVLKASDRAGGGPGDEAAGHRRSVRDPD